MIPPCTTTPPISPCNTVMQEEHERGGCVGLDVASGEPADPHLSGVLDNYIVKRQILQRWATGLLLMLGTCVVWRCPLL